MLFKPAEIGRRFKIPYKTVYNWNKEAPGTWRKDLYLELEKIYAKELAAKAKELDNE